MIEELRRFILVARNGNLTQTASKIFITQSALSQSLKRLEKELSVKLFMHKGKTLEITPEGKAVFELGTKMLILWEKAKTPEVRKSLRQQYAIGAFDNAALRLGKYFQQTINRNLFELEIVIGPSQKLLSQLMLGTIDIGICVVNKKMPLPSSLVLVQTFDEELIPVSAKKYKNAIEDIPFILYNKESFTRYYIDLLFTKKRLTPKIFAESTSVTFMKELAMLECGVALLPKNSVQTELKQKTLKKQHFPFVWKRECGIYISKNGRLAKDHVIIRDLITYLS